MRANVVATTARSTAAPSGTSRSCAAATASASTALTGAPSAAAAATTSSYSGAALTTSPPERASFTRTVPAADVDVDHLALERVLAHPVHRACRSSSSRRKTTLAHVRQPVGRRQHRQRVRRPALLHQDRGEPGVRRAGGEQGGQHARPQPRVEVVDVGLEHDGVVERYADRPRRSDARRRAPAARWAPGRRRGRRRRCRRRRRSSPAAAPTTTRPRRAGRRRSGCTPRARAARRAPAPRPPAAGRRRRAPAPAGRRAPCARVPLPTVTGEAPPSRCPARAARRWRRRRRPASRGRRPRGSAPRPRWCRAPRPRRAASRANTSSARARTSSARAADSTSPRTSGQVRRTSLGGDLHVDPGRRQAGPGHDRLAKTYRLDVRARRPRPARSSSGAPAPTSAPSSHVAAGAGRRRRTRRCGCPSRHARTRGAAGHPGGEHAGAEAVVDVADRHAGRAGVEHREQRGEAAVRRAVADRGRDRDEGHPGQAADDAGQRTLHPGDDDQAVGRVEPVAHGHQPVDPGDADVVHPLHAGAERPGDEGRLRRDRPVGRAGGRRRTPCRAARAAGRPQRRPPTSSTVASGNSARTAAIASGRQPGRHRRPGPGLAGQRAQDGDRLLDGLARGVDDLGVAGAQPAVRVDPGVAEVGGAVHRAGGQPVERGVHVDAAGRDLAQQQLDLRAVHAGRLCR